ncbi:MAG: hypothetical protein ACYSWU_10175 [Planctomycetota bacterium]|jgi:hypothetical protein
MRRRWALIWLVVVANALVALLPTVLFPLSLDRTVYWALSFAQGSLLGIWVVLGGKGGPWRLASAVVVTAALFALVEVGGTWLEAMIGGGLAIVMWLSLVLQQTIATSLPLLILRLLGLKLVEASWETPGLGASKLQFSLRALLGWTAAMAVLLSAIHYLPRRYFNDVLMYPWQQATWLELHALMALISIWAALSARSLPIRIGVFVLGVALVVAVDHLCWPRALRNPVFWIGESSFVLGSLWLIRLAGWRLVWRHRVRL